jgi:hypothetical protein
MIEVLHFQEEHLKRFTPRPWDVEGYAGKPWDEIYRSILDAQKNGPIWTGVDEDGSILCITGFTILWPGVAEGWGFFSSQVFKRPREVLGLYRRWIRAVMDSWELHRLQILVHCALYGGDRWAQAMGFECEGRMRRWGPDGKDYFRYALVR